MVFFTLGIAVVVAACGGAVLVTTEAKVAGSILVAAGIISMTAASISIEYERKRFHESILERMGK
jgi:hypothetical protein